MARNDIQLKSPIEPEFSTTPIVALGSAVSIERGEPTKLSTSGAVAIMVDADGTTGTQFTGIAKSDSTDTAAAAGTVTLWMPLPGLVYSAKAKTAANADTQAEVDALYGKRVIFDLTSTTWSVDTGASDSATNCVVIIGGDYHTSTVYFVYSISGTVLE
jgi:hypothetical protein